MNDQYQLDNGWVVENTTGIPVLHVTPIPNTLFRKKQNVVIEEKVFKAIVNGERNLKNLFQKFKLHKTIIENGSSSVKPNDQLINTPTKFYGSGFIVTQEEDKYYLDYQLARQGGGSRKLEISLDIYLVARSGKQSVSDLLKKYNLYQSSRTPE